MTFALCEDIFIPMSRISASEWSKRSSTPPKSLNKSSYCSRSRIFNHSPMSKCFSWKQRCTVSFSVWQSWFVVWNFDFMETMEPNLLAHAKSETKGWGLKYIQWLYTLKSILMTTCLISSIKPAKEQQNILRINERSDNVSTNLTAMNKTFKSVYNCSEKYMFNISLLELETDEIRRWNIWHTLHSLYLKLIHVCLPIRYNAANASVCWFCYRYW